MGDSDIFCVIKRNGSKEEVSFDKVTRRIKKLCYGLSDKINPIFIAQKVCSQIYNNVSTIELDELTAQICISLETTHLDYGILDFGQLVMGNYLLQIIVVLRYCSIQLLIHTLKLLFR